MENCARQKRKIILVRLSLGGMTQKKRDSNIVPMYKGILNWMRD